MNFTPLKDTISENELIVARQDFLIKEVRHTFEKALKEKEHGNIEKYHKFHNKFKEYKEELKQLREVI
jgi:predicted phage-related endonuclease